MSVLKISAVQIALFFLIMIFFNIESVWTLIVGLAVVISLVVLSKVYKQQSASIIEFFTSNKPTVLTVLIVLLFLYPLISPLMIRQNTYWLLILIQTGIHMILALGLNIQLGSTGVLNLAVAAFYGIGGYTAGLLSLHLGVPSIITLPLGGIVARTRLPREVIANVQGVIRDSLEYALANREAALPTMRQYAQEFDDDVLWQHVDLYVNDWTIDLGPTGCAALSRLSARAQEIGLTATEMAPLTVFSQ
jgi:hypothetical protein